MIDDPLSLLQKMQQDSLATAPGLPEEIQAVELWSGVGFRVGDIRLVTPLDHVTEILQYPVVTPVPRTREWVKGVANIRNTICTIIDLPLFFGKKPVFVDDTARVMILHTDKTDVGVLVNEVFGLRHFDEEEERQNVSGIDDPVMAHAQGAFLRDNILWGVFDMHALINSDAFWHVAA